MNSLRIVLGLMLAAGAVTAQQYTISTVAGIGTVQGYYGDTGAATSADLDFPFKVATDTKGNFYLADFYSFVVRMVSAAGIITDIAGNLTEGFQGDGGPADVAEISYVHGLAADSNGNVYFADTSNNRVRMITPVNDYIYTFAGNGVVGYLGDGGKAVNAELTFPAGIAVDSANNVFIADYGNSTVR